MSQTLSPSTATSEVVAEICRTLEPAHQSSLLDFAQFLKARETQASLDVIDEADEAEWERHFSDPAKVANFARWADASLARETPQPVDPTRL